MSLKSELEALGDSIRVKSGKTEKLSIAAMKAAVDGIVGGGGGADVSGVTATAPHVLEGDVFVDADGNEVTGTMKNNVAEIVYLTRSNSSFDIEEGYHGGGGEVRVRESSETVTPTKREQEVMNESDGFLSRVTVEAIPEKYQDVSVVTATAPHVLAGDIFVDAEGNEVVGTMPNNGVTGANLDTNNTSYSIPAGYTSGGAVGITTETKSATPTKSAQEIVPSGGKVLSKVSVGAIPAEYQNVTPVTATAPNVLAGDVFVNSSGTPVTGTMPKNGAVNIVLEKDQTYTIPKGYHPGTGVVSRASGGEVEFTITVNVDSGAAVTATKGSLSVSGTSVNGVCVLKVPEPGVWTIRANLNGVQFSETTAEVVTNFPATIIGLLSVSYTGTMTHKDSGLYRYYTITDTGVLTLNRPAALEYWVCGGGGNGYAGRYNSTSTKRAGGGAGGGGYFQTGTNSTDTNFTITIGAAAADSSIVSARENITALKGGNGGQWTGTSSVTAGGDGGAGASGGGGGYGGDNDSENRGLGGVGGGVSTIPFGDSYFTSYPCAGGHGGSRGNSSSSYRGGAGGSNGSSGNQGGWSNTGGGDAWASAATGGGTISSTGAKAATYYGSGGAGGCGIENYTAGGSGYQGVCFLRIPLSEFGL